MTIVSALSEHVRRTPDLTSESRRFRTEPETEVLAECSWQDDPTSHPTVVIHHGLTGDAGAVYIRATAAKAFNRGFNTVRLNMRNCGGTERLTPTLYHSGLTHDLGAVIDRLHEEGFEDIAAIGYSMGGNVVLKLAGEQGSSCRLSRIVAVSAPVELALASAAIDRGFLNGIYQRAFLSALGATVRRKAELFPNRYDVTRLGGIDNLRTFDDRFIAPCFGFDGAEDYYHRASSGRVLDAITIPALVIHARDDSFVPIAPIEKWRERRPSNVQFVLTDHGGHVGFLSDRSAEDEDRFWAENRAVDFVAGQFVGT